MLSLLWSSSTFIELDPDRSHADSIAHFILIFKVYSLQANPNYLRGMFRSLTSSFVLGPLTNSLVCIE